MSKFALHGLALILADEQGKDGICVNYILPRLINFDGNSNPGQGKDRNDFLSTKIPVTRIG